MAADAGFTDLRRTQRLLLSRKGEIHDGAAPIKALIRNASSRGMLLVCEKTYAPGQTLGLKFQTFSGDIIDCKVQVRHSGHAGTGVEIVSMGELDRHAYRQYLRDGAASQPAAPI